MLWCNETTMRCKLHGFWGWIPSYVLWQISSTDMLFYGDNWISKDLEVWFAQTLISSQTDAEFLQSAGARFIGMLWQLCCTLVIQSSCKSGCAGQLSRVYGCLALPEWPERTGEPCPRNRWCSCHWAGCLLRKGGHSEIISTACCLALLWH